MRKQTNDANNRLPTHHYQSSRVHSRIKHCLLLYWPSRNRAWLYRLPFYFLAFFVIPLLSIAALGAYVGPDQTLAGIPAVLFMIFLAIVARIHAVRADATFRTPEVPDTWHRISETWPFPLEDPPPRRLAHGYTVSATGIALRIIGWIIGCCAAGVVSILPKLLFSGVEGQILSVPVAIVLGISAIVGIPISVVAVSAGTRLQDRGRRLRARDARRLLQRPGERPVLLLRSFDDEELVDPHPMNLLLQRRYEENLSRALKQFGPVITVGRPGDSLGFSGAARFYVSQDNWQRAIRYLMTHAATVVIIVGRTEGLWWEIGTAFECVSREHLLFFFPLVVTAPRNFSLVANFKVLTRFKQNLVRYKQMDTEQQARYQLFRQRSAKFLVETLPVDLKDALFLDFLPDGQARVLRSRFSFLLSPYWFLFWFLRSQLLLVLHAARFFMPRLRVSIPILLRPDFSPGFSMTRTLWPFMAKLYKVA